jgi:hypothetical protein
MDFAQRIRAKQDEFFKTALKKMKNEKMERMVNDNYSKFKCKLRKVMTGDEKVRVRDHVLIAQGTTENFKLFDKLAFTFGVLNLMMCQFCFINTPGYFWVFYSIIMTISIISRYIHFKSLDWEYFMYDFCYFALVCNMASAVLYPEGNWFSRVSFIFANGPLPLAIVIWRNSYVFHDYDRMFSVYIHLLPSMLSYVGLNNGHCSLLSLMSSNKCEVHASKWCKNIHCFQPARITASTLTFTDYGLAILFYILWQIAYFVLTEVIDKDYLNSHPEKVTSLRWLAADTKNPFARFVLKKLRMIGVFGPTEDYDSKTIKTLVVFMSTQLVYTIFTFLPGYFMYRWHAFHFCFILSVAVIALYNGASYYFDVFSARYMREVERVTTPGRNKAARKSPLPKVNSKDVILPVPPTIPVTTVHTEDKRKDKDTDTDTEKDTDRGTDRSTESEKENKIATAANINVGKNGHENGHDGLRHRSDSKAARANKEGKDGRDGKDGNDNLTDGLMTIGADEVVDDSDGEEDLVSEQPDLEIE